MIARLSQFKFNESTISYIVIAWLVLQVPVLTYSFINKYEEHKKISEEVTEKLMTGLTHTEVLERILTVDERKTRQAILYSKGNRVQPEVFLLLIDLWEMNQDVYPKFDWDMLSKEIIRAALAEALADAARKGRVEIDLEPFHRQLRFSAESSDKFIQRFALIALLEFDDPGDIEIFLRVIESDDQEIHRTALGSLAYMCNEQSQETYQMLRETLPIEKQIYIKEIDRRQKGDPYRCN